MGGPAVPGFWLPHHLQSFQHVQNRSKSSFFCQANGHTSMSGNDCKVQGRGESEARPSLPRAMLVVPSMEKKQSPSKYRVFRG